MDFADRIKELAERAIKQADHLQTEEATKNALVMPLISALGYDVFDPTEVVPEFVADVGTKKGEKVDYAVLRNGSPIILFECKAQGVKLEENHTSQLFRYFGTTDTRFGVLTNGIVYQFFSDLERPNRMDTKPFLVVDLTGLDDLAIVELKKFSKETFDLEGIVATASDLKYAREIRRLVTSEFSAPSDEFVSFFASKVYDGRITKGVREQFSGIVRRALREFLNDRISGRLHAALESEEAVEADAQEESTAKIDTTDMEWQGFYIVRAIGARVVDPKRIAMRDAQSYCAILFDNNNRQPICRLWFNASKKYLGLFDDDKNEERIAIETVEDLYRSADSIQRAIERYLPAE